MTYSSENVNKLQLEADRLRALSIRATTEAGSGHPTSCASAAEIVASLFFSVMRYDPADPGHPMNDRFVLSKGHAAPLLYAALADAGAIPAEELMTLRRIDSDLEGHPTPRMPWAYIGTGSLGQGLSAGVGMALSWKYLDKVDRRCYVLMGDGEVAEGAVWESCELAAHYKLDNLVAIVDVNGLGQSQETMYGHDIEAYARKFDAFGWRAVTADGHDCRELLEIFAEAKKVHGQPTAIIARTVKGKGVSFVEGKNGFHGKPFSEEDAERALKEISPPESAPHFEIEKPPSASPPQKDSSLAPAAPDYPIGQEVATREAYGTALAKLGDADPRVVSLDGDVKNSTFAQTFMEAHPDRFFECFIAEQNMVGAAAGMATCGKIPFASSFGAFLARAYDQIRMAGISRSNIKIVGSHCGVSIGEDGPSQMALEDIAMMRAIPNCVVLYPSDAVSSERLVAEAASYQGMAYIRTSRPKTPVIYANDETFPIGGLKVLRKSESDRVCVAAAGVTLHEALKAYDMLKNDDLKIRVIDLYSIKPIPAEALAENAAQTNNTLITVEDHYPEGGIGDAAASALSTHGIVVHKLAVNGIPRSGKSDELMHAYGVSAQRIVEKVREASGG